VPRSWWWCRLCGTARGETSADPADEVRAPIIECQLSTTHDKENAADTWSQDFKQRLRQALVLSRVRTQADLAAQLGVSRATVNVWLSAANDQKPAIDKVVPLAQALGVPVGWLLGEISDAEFFSRAPSAQSTYPAVRPEYPSTGTPPTPPPNLVAEVARVLEEDPDGVGARIVKVVDALRRDAR